MVLFILLFHAPQQKDRVFIFQTSNLTMFLSCELIFFFDFKKIKSDKLILMLIMKMINTFYNICSMVYLYSDQNF